MAKLFDVQFALLQKSLNFRTKRNSLLASNVANLETPGYKSRDLVFEDALGKALKARMPGPLTVTNAKHLDGSRALPLDLVQPQLIQTATPDAALDGNTVNLETEMAKLAENQLAYQAFSQMISHKFQVLKTAIREGSA